VLEQFLWISVRILNDAFVFGLPGLVHHVHGPLLGLSLRHVLFSYARVSVCSHAFSRSFLLPESFFRKVSSPSLLQFVLENSVSVLREPYSLNW